MELRIFGILVGLIVANGTIGQGVPAKKTDEWPCAAAYFRDGSLLKVKLLEKDFKVVTEFGELKIPFSKASRIDFGWHYPEGMEKKVSDSIRSLTSSSYREREDATKYLLEAGHFALPLLKETSQNQGDIESSRRATAIIKRLKYKLLPELISVKEHDTIHTEKFPVVGRVAGFEFKAHNQHVGELSLKFSELRAIRLAINGGEKEFSMDIAKHGSAPDQWMDTAINVNPDFRLIIKAEGIADIWPQGPGQYMSTPKGYTTAGKGSSFMAGALVGRVGEQGKEFLVGENYDGRPAEEGRLFLRVIPSPWNNSSMGSYHVRINTSYALTK